MLIVSIVSFWVINTKTYIHTDIKPVYKLFEFSQLSDFIGNQLYAMESIGTLFTVRSTLKKRSNMKNVLKYSFRFILLLFIVNGISFILTYDSKDI